MMIRALPRHDDELLRQILTMFLRLYLPFELKSAYKIIFIGINIFFFERLRMLDDQIYLHHKKSFNYVEQLHLTLAYRDSAWNHFGLNIYCLFLEFD